MKKKFSLILAVIMIISSMTVTVSATELDLEKFSNDVDFLKKVVNFVNNSYLYDVDQDDIMEGLYDGFFNVLDEYSVYYTPEEYNSFVENSAGAFVGIGVQIVEVDNQVVVLTPLPDSPALKAGVKAGDIIISVDGKDVKGMSAGEVSNLIKGEEGTRVNVGFSRDGKEIKFDIDRAAIITSNVKGKIIDGVGYIKISEFAENTVELVEDELAKFDEENITKVILDLRNNGGGLTDSAVDLLNLFVTEGPVLYIDYADGSEQPYYSTLKKQKYDLALLVNEGTASASEIFAGAVKDKKEGTIVGTKTFGKGIAQTLVPLNNNAGGVKFTVAEFFTTSKNKIHGVGITPDIVVENPEFNYADFHKFSDDKVSTLGDVNLEVLSAEMILAYTDYLTDEPDGVLDQKTFDALKAFQKDSGLTADGVLEIKTKTALLNALSDYELDESRDLQLQAALKALK